MRRLILALAVAVALGAAVPAIAQAPTVQQAVATYLAGLPADFNGIGAPALKARIDAGEKVFILDVREPAEFANGYIAGAVNIPIRTLAQNLEKFPAKDAPIVAYCGVGTRGAYATMALTILGYTNVKNLAQGMTGWIAQGFPVVK